MVSGEDVYKAIGSGLSFERGVGGVTHRDTHSGDICVYSAVGSFLMDHVDSGH